MTTTASNWALQNRGAPADRVIQLVHRIADSGSVRDGEDGTCFATADEALTHWYGLDDLIIEFTVGGDYRCVRLIHQVSYARPSEEDIADYSMGLLRVPEFKKLLEQIDQEARSGKWQ